MRVFSYTPNCWPRMARAELGTRSLVGVSGWMVEIQLALIATDSQGLRQHRESNLNTLSWDGMT